MSRKKMFYHVTSVDSVENILHVGLKGGTTPRYRPGTKIMDEPSIFVLISGEDSLTDHIAISQIWPNQNVGDYAVIEIDPTGITGLIIDDNVAERSAPWQRIIQQKVIKPKYLKLARIRSLNYPCEKVTKIYLSWFRRKWTAEEWTIARKWIDQSTLDTQEQFELGTSPLRTTSKRRKIKATKRKAKRK